MIVREITNLLAADIRTAAPVLICAMGLVFSSRAGIVNIGAEGMMLTGAFMGTVGSYFLGNVWAGAVVAMLSSMVMALIFGYFTITVKADQTVVGTAINTLGLGLTTTLSRVIFGMGGERIVIPAFQELRIPLLSEMPILGKALFSSLSPVYLIILFVPIAHIVMFKSNLGLKIRAVGEHPRACDTLGINVFHVRYGAVLFSGLMAGFAGIFLSLGSLNFFTENMVAGRGFMAVAVVVFANYKPLNVLWASLLFGSGEAIMYRLQAAGTGIPFQFMLMMPYALTILALCGFVGKSQAPAASSLPYSRE